jgi:hypothetical protein
VIDVRLGLTGVRVGAVLLPLMAMVNTCAVPSASAP